MGLPRAGLQSNAEGLRLDTSDTSSRQHLRSLFLCAERTPETPVPRGASLLPLENVRDYLQLIFDRVDFPDVAHARSWLVGRAFDPNVGLNIVNLDIPLEFKRVPMDWAQKTAALRAAQEQQAQHASGLLAAQAAVHQPHHAALGPTPAPQARVSFGAGPHGVTP